MRGPTHAEIAMKRLELIQKALQGDLKWVEVAEVLGLTARQVRRLRADYEEFGPEVLLDKRHGLVPRNKKPEEFVRKILALYRDEYREFNVQHFHEKLWAEHRIQVSYSWVKYTLQRAGLVAKRSKPGPYRSRRERRPMRGMMLQIDGSDHHWLGENHRSFNLVATVDDATNEILSAYFAEKENTRSVFFVLREVIEKCGIFCSLYSDRASHFFFTDKSGEKVDPRQITQCQRAMSQLGIQMLPSYSPQARGRIERLWKTLQGRLPPELKKARVDSIEEANRYLRETFVPEYNRKFTRQAALPESAFTTVHPNLDLNRIFSIQHQRQVRNDNCVSYKTLLLQLPRTDFRHSFFRCEVTVHEHLDRSYSITLGPRLIARYDSLGRLLKQDAEIPIQRAVAKVL